MRNRSGWWVIIIIMALLDLYVFQAVKLLTQGAGERVRLLIHSAYWLISGAALITMMLLPYINYETWPKSARTYIFSIIVGLFFAKLVISLFLLIDDVRRGAVWMIERFYNKAVTEGEVQEVGISRSVFLSWLGVGLGSTLFGTLLYGFSNKYRYQLVRQQLKFDNLPAAFRGLKIIHISDIHSGSFNDVKAVNHGIDLILKENADLILFTGDLVNDRATEMEEYIATFGRLKAPLGVYATLGNHDYGDYVRWDSTEAKQANLEQLKQTHATMGWRLLMNEHVVLEKGDAQIALLGIENWGAKARFPKYGKLEDAWAGTEKHPFKILMSHDPSHWDAEVRPKYPDVDLTLSGHTHGMQFGVELPGFKWSPVQFIYKQWAGLYEDGKQKLYVNRGFGFIGYPGRVGILPEITVIELV